MTRYLSVSSRGVDPIPEREKKIDYKHFIVRYLGIGIILRLNPKEVNLRITLKKLTYLMLVLVMCIGLLI